MNTPSIALFEIGSNQLQLLIGHYRNGQLHITHESAATLRLGGAIDAQGQLTAEATAATMQTLQQWQSHWQSCAPTHRFAVATQVLREARNALAFNAAFHRLVDCHINTITGEQEATWGYAGALHGQMDLLATTPCRVLDIGGRSTEISWGRGQECLQGHSMPVGAVSWAQRYFPQGTLSHTAFEQAVAAAKDVFQSIAPHDMDTQPARTYAIAGTAQALAALLHQLGYPQGQIAQQHLQSLQMQLIDGGWPWLRSHCRYPEDLEVVLGGCISAMMAALHALQLEHIDVAKGGLRYGALHAFAKTLAH